MPFFEGSNMASSSLVAKETAVECANTRKT